MDHHGWNVIDAEAGVLWREYRFSGPARATTLVFRGADQGLVVVSPGTGLSSAEYDALKDFGEVRALLANNLYHHMGQEPWRARFPDAHSYAPPRAVPLLHKKLPSIPFRSLSELPLPPQVRWEDPPGFKVGEAILRIGTRRGSLWFTGDLLTNITKLPPPPLRWLFTWTGSGPGFRLFMPAVWRVVQQRQALRDWALARVAQEPPAIVVPAHGQPMEAPDLPALVKAQLERL